MTIRNNKNEVLLTDKRQKSRKIVLFLSLITFIIINGFSVYAQAPTAIFSVNPGGGCTPLSVDFNDASTTGSGGSIVSWSYDFGDGNDTILYDDGFVVHVYAYPTFFSATLTVEDVSGNTSSTSQNINVLNAPDASFTVDNSNPCRNVPVTFERVDVDVNSYDSLVWDFGDGTISRELDIPISHAYTTNANRTVTLTYYNEDCEVSTTQNVTTAGPEAEFIVDTDEGCENDQVTFTLSSQTGVTSYEWFPLGIDLGGEGVNTSPHIHTYDTKGKYTAALRISDGVDNCVIDTVINIYKPVANIDYFNTTFCSNQDVLFRSGTEGDPSVWLWTFSNGTSSTDANPTKQFDEGTIDVKLRVEHAYGCADSTTDAITINARPQLETIGSDVTICLGESTQLSATGNTIGDRIEWTPPVYIDNPFVETPIVTPTETTEYFPQFVNSTTNCRSEKNQLITVSVIQVSEIKFNLESIPEAVDDSIKINIGESVEIGFELLSGNVDDYVFGWLPTDYLSCSDCSEPTITPEVDGSLEYTLTVADKYKCGSKDTTITLAVDERYANVGVPKAFTPNGDHLNDTIKVDGWGIKPEIEFRIYNRWGNEVFFSDNIDLGWDGTYDGKEQAVGTYSYYFKVERFDGIVLEERGTFTLLR